MKTFFFPVLMCVSLSLMAQNTNIQWRNDRTGIYNETGLLKTWPAEGPELLWYYDSLDEGFSSVAIANNKIYITGMTDSTGHLYVFDLSGKLLNKKAYGNEWALNYIGSRSTITIDNGKLYLYSGAGVLTCMDQNTLNTLWTKDIVADLGGTNIRWGVNESPLIVAEKLILTPGGEKNNVVALNKNDGSLIWACAGEGDSSAYCSPLYIGSLEVPQVVTFTANHVLGIHAATGEKLWSFKIVENKHSIQANTPIYADNMLFCSTGHGVGSNMLRFRDGGRSVEHVWSTKDLEPETGGVVKIGDRLYASGDHKKAWFCVDWNTGETLYRDSTLNVGATIAADGMLYCYTHKGDMALVKPTPDKFEIAGRFPITLGTAQHWAHPVIHRGILYVRHGSALMAYKIIDN